MHFWISKPAGRYYSGRRYPATPMPKTLYNDHLHSRHLRQMVTPIQRFNHLGANNAGPSRPSRSLQPVISSATENNQPEESIEHSQLRNISNNVTNTGNTQHILSNVTTNRPNQTLLDLAEFADVELANYRLRRGVLIASILLVGLIATAKLYFGLQDPGYEILIFCGLWMLLLTVCLYSILYCCAQGNRRREQRVSQDHIVSLTTANTVGNENIRLIPLVRQNPPPPPYHIAILSPPTNMLDEAPPPSYDKIMQ